MKYSKKISIKHSSRLRSPLPRAMSSFQAPQSASIPSRSTNSATRAASVATSPSANAPTARANVSGSSNNKLGVCVATNPTSTAQKLANRNFIRTNRRTISSVGYSNSSGARCNNIGESTNGATRSKFNTARSNRSGFLYALFRARSSSSPSGTPSTPPTGSKTEPSNPPRASTSPSSFRPTCHFPSIRPSLALADPSSFLTVRISASLALSTAFVARARAVSRVVVDASSANASRGDRMSSTTDTFAASARSTARTMRANASRGERARSGTSASARSTIAASRSGDSRRRTTCSAAMPARCAAPSTAERRARAHARERTRAAREVVVQAVVQGEREAADGARSRERRG